MDEIDRIICTRLKADDSAVLELIWDRYADSLFGFLMSMLCSRHDAEDALQEVFVKIARKRHLVGSARNLKSYLFQMAKHEGIQEIHRRSRNTTMDPEEDFWLLPVTSDPLNQIYAKDLASALQSLPEEQRTVVVLKTFQQMTLKEISELFNLSQNTVASRLRYGLEKLRDLFKEEFS